MKVAAVLIGIFLIVVLASTWSQRYKTAASTALGAFADEEPADYLFRTEDSDFSLQHLKLILPDFIQVTSQSQLTGNFDWKIESLSQARVDADVVITFVQVNHPALARVPVVLPELSIRGRVTWNRSDKTIQFSGLTVGSRAVKLGVNGVVAYGEGTAVTLSLSLPETPLQDVVDALPAELIPKIKGAQVGGKVAFDMAFVADPRHPEASRFEPDIRINGYRLIQEPVGIPILGLKSEYTVLVRKNGAVVREMLLSEANPRYVSYARLSEPVRKEILKAEDVGFFHHTGFNLEEIHKALIQNMHAKGYARGGSTITMQLAKNLFLDGQRTLSRKLEEALLTYALENELSKERILEIYVNIIEWGQDIYGLSEASDHYFAKDPSELTQAEAAQLASIIPSPLKRAF